MARRELDKSKLPLASEQGSTLFASNRVIGLRYKEQGFSAIRPYRNGWLTLRVLLLACCCSELNSNPSLRRVVLLRGLTGRQLLDVAQGKVVLLTAAWLPSDKVHISLQYQPFRHDYPASLAPAQQPQTPLRWFCVLPTRASAKCLKPRASSPYFTPLTFPIAEGLDYQVKIPQTTLYYREAKAVSS